MRDASAEHEVPRDCNKIESQIRKATHTKGLIIVNTGHGKGKSTSAFGLMTRAWGRGLKVSVVQFIKTPSQYGEQMAAKKMGIDWVSSGDGFTWRSKDIDESAAKALHGWNLAKERIATGGFDIVILDEFTYPLIYKWVDTTCVIAWLESHKPKMLHVVITGRDAPTELIEYADLVTEMREVKHPYKDQSVQAQAGIEF
ncbi:MAG: cob(I)yrinic acid a,c-diamide adenosyltransferase [Planctomycetes bacterium]|jgi:cob(I)alamin adenosyltransferase|nr:cob(I)yrinic acid a,c-diamide adenosyltransferase [Planctomycetota bacterium]